MKRFSSMTADQFRILALSASDAIESEHMNHPDFRVKGKIFASLGYPDNGWAMVKLTSEQQGQLVKKSSETFTPCDGVWGERGATNVHLASAKVALVRGALKLARQNVMLKKKS
jgi:hypothetical protein